MDTCGDAMEAKSSKDNPCHASSKASLYECPPTLPINH